MAHQDGRFGWADFRRECTLKVEGDLRSIHAQAAGPRPSPTSVASYSPLSRFVLVDALFWRLKNTWIKNNISRQNSEQEVGWWKICIPENLELEMWTVQRLRPGILQPGITSCVSRLDSTTNQWVFLFRKIPLIFVKIGKQVPFRVYSHLISFSIVSRSHVTHLCLVTVKMFYWKWGILSQTAFTLFYRFSMVSSKGFRMLPFN